MPSVVITPPGPLPTQFADLVRLHAPRAIHDEVEYENTMAVIRALLDETTLSAGQADYLETLSVLAEAYERANHSLEDAPARTGLDRLRHVLDESGTTVEQLAAHLGIDVRSAERIVAGQLPLTDDQAVRLGTHFHVRAALFRTD